MTAALKLWAWGIGFLLTVTVGFRLLIAALDTTTRWRQHTTVSCTCGWHRTRRSADRAAQDYVNHRDIIHGSGVFDFEDAS